MRNFSHVLGLPLMGVLVSFLPNSASCRNEGRTSPSTVLKSAPIPPDGQRESAQYARFLPDGRLLTLSAHTDIPHPLNGCGRSTPWGPDFATLWDPVSGTRLVTTQTADLEMVRLAPDGQTLVEFEEDTCCRGGTENRLRIYKLADMRRPVHVHRKDSSFLMAAAFSEDSCTLLTIGYDEPLTAWDLKTGRRKLVCKPRLTGFTLGAAGGGLYSITRFDDHDDEVGGPATVSVYLRDEKGKIPARRYRLPERAGSGHLTHDGRLLICSLKPEKETPAAVPGAVVFYDVCREYIIETFPEPALPGYTNSTDGPKVLIRGTRVYDTSVLDAVASDGVSGQKLLTLREFDGATPAVKQTYYLEGAELKSVADLSEDGRRAAIWTSGMGLQIWDLASGEITVLLPHGPVQESALMAPVPRIEEPPSPAVAPPRDNFRFWRKGG